MCVYIRIRGRSVGSVSLHEVSRRKSFGQYENRSMSESGGERESVAK